MSGPSRTPGHTAAVILIMRTSDRRRWTKAWNARDWGTFDAYHHHDDVVVYWPGRPTPTFEAPTTGASLSGWPCLSRPQSQAPLRHSFDEGGYTFVTRFTGTFSGPLELPDGPVVQPTGKSFDVLYSTTAHWLNGKIVEE